MTKLKRGTLYITREDIIKHLGLTEDTYVQTSDNKSGEIVIEVIASGENTHSWLIDNNEQQWNTSRAKLELAENQRS